MRLKDNLGGLHLKPVFTCKERTETRGGITLCLSLLPSCCHKHHNQKQLGVGVGERTLTRLLSYSPSWKKSQGRNSREGLEADTGAETTEADGLTGLLFMPCLDCLLIEPRTTGLNGTAHSILGLPCNNQARKYPTD